MDKWGFCGDNFVLLSDLLWRDLEEGVVSVFSCEIIGDFIRYK